MNLFIISYYSQFNAHCLKGPHHVKKFYSTRGYNSMMPSSWLPDIGDDPSFIARSIFKNDGGEVTWGVCRKGTREIVNKGDIVSFFAMNENGGNIDYYFVGFAVVKEKISQYDIWNNPENRIYRHYANLLIRPTKSGVFTHKEWPRKISYGKTITGCPPSQSWHSNWLSLIAKKSWLNAAKRTINLTCPGSIAPSSVPLSNNYCILHKTKLLEKPIKVACYRASTDHVEQWLFHDSLVRDIYSMTLGLKCLPQNLRSRHNLRKRNCTRQCHPHIRKEISNVWVTIMSNVLFSKYSLKKAPWA